MGVLHLQLLGAFALRRADGSRLAVSTRKTAALLAFLAIFPGRLHAREALATLLWGDAPDLRARHSLRQALAFLRRAFGGDATPFTTEGDAVGIVPQAIEVDTATFERLLREGGAASLERAVALYRGDLLEHFGLVEAPFEEWLAAERRRLRGLAIEAMVRLLAHQERAAPAASALATAERLLLLDPLQEAAHRATMRLMLAQDRRGAALRQYQLCAETLDRELGAAPEAETRALYRQVLRQAQPDEGSGGAAEPTIGDGILIGREASLHRLYRALDAAWSGQGGMVLLSGEAGVGKTRLIAALSGEVERRGGRVLIGRCFESERVLPFHGWVDALRSAGIPGDDALLGGLDATRRSELARLLPELGARSGQHARRQQGYLALFQILTDVLTGLGRDRPIVVVLDDLHWADAMSARLMGYVGRRLEGHRVLLLGSVRAEELPLSPGLTAVLDELAEGGYMRRIELAPLNRALTGDLLAARAGPGIDQRRLAELETEIWRVSEGNPFVVVESLRALDNQRAGLPRSVRGATRARLRRLSRNARAMAAMAAAVGREVDFELLRRATGLDGEGGAEALEELVRRRLLEVDREAFRFVHARVRQVIYDDLLPPRRVLLHRSILAALEAEHAGRLEQAHDSLAHHAALAGDDQRALTYLLGLADDAAQRYAVDEATRLLEAAFIHAERTSPANRDRAAVDVLFRLTDNLIFIGQPDTAVERLQGQAARVARIGDDWLSAQHHFWLAHALSFLDASETSEHHAERCRALAEQVGDRSLIGKAHCLIARACGLRDQAERGLQHARQAIALLAAEDEPSWLGHAHWQVAVSCSAMGRSAEVLAAGARARELGEARGDRRLQTCAWWAISWGHLDRLDVAASIVAAQTAVEIAPDAVHRAASQVYLGGALVSGQQPAEAVALLEAALPVLRQSAGVRFLLAHGGFNLAAGYLAVGRLEQAETTALEAVKQARASGWKLGLGRAQHVLGQVAQARGAPVAAEAHLRDAMRILAEADAQTSLGLAEMTLADVLHRRGVAAEAASLLGRARGRFKAHGWEPVVARADALAKSMARQRKQEPIRTTATPRRSPAKAR